jgi:hypothetical protein
MRRRDFLWAALAAAAAPFVKADELLFGKGWTL